MRWIRSWPPAGAEGGCHVEDKLPRYRIKNHDYSDMLLWSARTAPGEGMVVVEWDIAFGLEQYKAFDDAVNAHPNKALTAPYRVYPESTGLPKVQWVPRVPAPGERHGGEIGWRWVTRDEAFCALWGLGLTYVPWHLIEGWNKYKERKPDVACSDYELSKLHFSYAGSTEICWDVIPVHLHW